LIYNPPSRASSIRKEPFYETPQEIQDMSHSLQIKKIFFDPLENGNLFLSNKFFQVTISSLSEEYKAIDSTLLFQKKILRIWQAT